MPHLHNTPNGHDLTVSAYIINIETPDQPKLLLHLHKRLRKLMQPGGHVELDENPWYALGREILEETGYAPHHLELLEIPGNLKIILPNPAIVVQPVPTFLNTHPMDNGLISHYHTDLSYVFLAKNPPKYKVSEEESNTFQLVTLEELATIPADQISSTAKTVGQEILKAYKNGIFVATKLNDE